MNLFFDLDGTLTDPADGLTRSFAHALQAMGRPVPAREALERFIGIPMQDVLRELMAGAAPDETARAVGHFRERFSTVGLFENRVYDGVPEGLTELHGRGHALWVATSKPEVYASRILEHFDLARWFRGVYGSDLSGRNSRKDELLGRLLATEHLDPAASWMIGDRARDIEGARANGVGAVAVTWGYGTAEELRAAAPDVTVASMRELDSWLRRLSA